MTSFIVLAPDSWDVVSGLIFMIFIMYCVWKVENLFSKNGMFQPKHRLPLALMSNLSYVVSSPSVDIIKS